MDSSSTPLACVNLSKRFGSTVAVNRLSLEVNSGEIVGVVGPNGCGKSTFLRLVVGLLRPDEGQAHVAGHVAGSLAARRMLGYIPDINVGLDELSITEFIRLHGSLHGGDAVYYQRTEALLDVFRLSERKASSLASLSNGMRRQVTMVTALALQSKLYVLDEATAALDPETIAVLRVAVAAVVSSGSGLLLATQDLAFAQAVCSRVYLLQGGTLAASGTIADLMTAYDCSSLEEVFLRASGDGGLIDLARTRLADL